LQSLSAFFCFFRAGRKRDGSTPWTWVIHTLPASHAYRISYPSSWEPISALSVQGRVLPLMLPRNMGFQAGGQKVKNSTLTAYFCGKKVSLATGWIIGNRLCIMSRKRNENSRFRNLSSAHGPPWATLQVSSLASDVAMDDDCRNRDRG
jgi:hypothetical protein